MKQWLKNLFFWLTVIGGVVWGLTLFNWNPIALFLPVLAQQIVYGAVGISALVTGYNKIAK